jgi:hypothetical protein
MNSAFQTGGNRLFLARSQASCVKENGLAVEEIPRPTRRCFTTGRTLAPGERYRTELRLTEEGWDRRDFSLDSSPERSDEPTAWWEAELPPGPPPQLPARELDARLMTLVERWGTSAADEDGKRRYAAVMLLAGRKALKLQEIVRDADNDLLVFVQGRGKPPIQVADPGLNDEELKRRQAEVVELAQNSL